jgi:hypothetical protein
MHSLFLNSAIQSTLVTTYTRYCNIETIFTLLKGYVYVFHMINRINKDYFRKLNYPASLYNGDNVFSVTKALDF